MSFSKPFVGKFSRHRDSKQFLLSSFDPRFPVQQKRARRIHTGRVLIAPFHYDFLANFFDFVS
jgi:hypothetical protein